MNLELDDRRAIVTGAGSGIGAATARRLATEGAKVLLVDRDGDAVQAVAAEIGGDADDVVPVTVDVSRSEDVERMVQTAVDRWGGLDCAVNNAGVSQRAARIADLTEEQFDRLLEVNAKGVWLCMRAEIPAMLSGGAGAIVNVTSVAAHTAAALQGAYAGTKHAALGLTRGAALDYASDGIRVVAVSPGVVDTPMVSSFVAEAGDPHVLDPVLAAHALGRSATPEEVADTIAWALSDRASFVTGSAILVDGGYTAA